MLNLKQTLKSIKRYLRYLLELTTGYFFLVTDLVHNQLIRSFKQINLNNSSHPQKSLPNTCDDIIASLSDGVSKLFEIPDCVPYLKGHPFTCIIIFSFDYGSLLCIGVLGHTEAHGSVSR